MLYTLGNIVFVSSEFKGNTNMVPRVLILLLFKIIALSLLLIRMYHYAFSNDNILQINNLMYVFGAYIITESIVINKMIRHSDELMDKITDSSIEFDHVRNKFIDRYTKIGGKTIITCNNILVIFSFSFLILSIAYLIDLLIIFPNVYNYTFLFGLVLICGSKYLLLKFIYSA